MRYFFALLLILISSQAYSINEAIDSVLVIKSEKAMYLLASGEKIREYKVTFGGDPIGHKQQEGDERTPEGKYVLDY
jgi:murein L,D-transpeptidase YafK